MICGPFLAGGRFEVRRVLEDLRPFLLAVFQEESRVEGDAAVDLFFGCCAVLVTNLLTVSQIITYVVAVDSLYLVGRPFAFND
jgi:hypothetical protein